MDYGRHKFLRCGNTAYNLSTNIMDRLITRGLGQGLSKEIMPRPILPIINSEAHILCSEVDVTKAQVAFGRWALPKLKKELLSKDMLIAKRAIMTLLDMIYDPEKAVEAIRLQVIPRLVRLMNSDDEFVRQHTLMILEVLAMQPHGKLAIFNNKFIMPNMFNLLSDHDKNVRLSAAKTLQALATGYLGLKELIDNVLISTIITRLNTETEDEITIILLDVLELLLDQDMETKLQCLNNDGIKLTVLLEHPVARIRSGTASIIAQLMRHPSGKKELLQNQTDILTKLTALLQDSDVVVKTQAAAALMFVMCTTEAKMHCLKMPTPLYLIYCAQTFRLPELQTNSIKCLTSLAESPKGQALLKNNMYLIEAIRPSDSIVQMHKYTLLNVIKRVI